VDHFRTYLRGELARLTDESIAADLIRSAYCTATELSGGPPSKLAARFETQSKTDSFVLDLRDEVLVRLTNCLSLWRNNNVRHELSRSQAAQFEEIKVELIRLNDAEPALHQAFERNGRELARIAIDPEILANANYSRHQPGERVELPICLAKPDPDSPMKFRVIDGVHRSIQLFRNGHAQVTLCVFRPRALF